MKHSTGFTLIELMITIAISSILLTMAAPSVQSMLARNKTSSSYNNFVGAIRYARSEAIKRGNSTAICKWNSVSNACDNSNSWEDGWAIFDDLDDDGVKDNNEEILRVSGKLPKNINMVYSRNYVSFTAQGFATGASGSIIFCSGEEEGALGAVISLTGHIRVKETAADECP